MQTFVIIVLIGTITRDESLARLARSFDRALAHMRSHTLWRRVWLRQTMASSFPSLLSGDLSYVDPIPPTLDIECPVCFGILFEPYLSDCCGHHFCGTCIPKLKYKPCPLCKKSFSTMLNLSLQRLVKSVKIYCPNNIVGCEWKGELSFIR